MRACFTKVTILIVLILASIIKLDAQVLSAGQPEQDACNAIEICSQTFTAPYAYQGIGAVSDLTSSPCGGGEGNTMWLVLHITSSGSIVFVISPNTTTDDYDFAVLNITGGNCSNLSSSQVVRCNFNNNNAGSNVNGQIGLNTTSTSTTTTSGTFGGSYLQQINAIAGETYLIMINNFGTYSTGNLPTSGFTIDFTGSTATFNNPGPPKFNQLIAQCDYQDSVTISLDQMIKCSSIANNGSDFTISPSGTIAGASGINCFTSAGYTNRVKLYFATPLANGDYTIHANTGSDGNTLLNLCNDALALPDSIKFHVGPIPIHIAAIDSPACYKFKIQLSEAIDASTVATNGSDFNITGPSNPVITAVNPYSVDANNFTNTLLITLQNPISVDGHYLLHAQLGTDGNTLQDSCGNTPPIGDTLGFNVNSYNGQLSIGPDTALCNYGDKVTLDVNNTGKGPSQSLVCGTNNTPAMGVPQYAQIGTGTTYNFFSMPFYQYQEAGRFQYIIRASELQNAGLDAGVISKMALFVAYKYTISPFHNLKIKMGCTSQNALTASFVEGLSTVYEADTFSTILGENTFNFQNTFDWDGVSNIVVEICRTEPSLNFYFDYLNYTTTSYSSAYYRYDYNNTTLGCEMTNTNGYTYSYYYTYRPNIKFTISPPPALPFSYTWSPSNLVNNITSSQATVTTTSDSNIYHVETIDYNHCYLRDSVLVKVIPFHTTLSPDSTQVCYGDTVHITVDSGIYFTWSQDPNFSSTSPNLDCISCKTTEFTGKTIGYNNIFVVAEDAKHCRDTLESVILVNPIPDLNAQAATNILKYGDTLTIWASNASSYFWYPENVVLSPNNDTTGVIPTSPMWIYVNGIDSNQCIGHDSIYVDINYDMPVRMPNAFSPNGDGVNDLFRPVKLTYQTLITFDIYNRRGQKVFSTQSADGGWDGTFGGKPAATDTYFYILKLEKPNHEQETFKGDVTLIR